MICAWCPSSSSKPQPCQARRSVGDGRGASERGEPGADRLGAGQLLAQLQREFTQQVLGLADQVLAGCHDRAPAVVPQGQQLVLLIGAVVLAGALERLGSSGCASTSRAIRSLSSVSDLPR